MSPATLPRTNWLLRMRSLACAERRCAGCIQRFSDALGQVLNYERMLGSSVVQSQKEKVKSFTASKKYVEVKRAAEAAAQSAKSAEARALKELKAANEVKQNLQAMGSNVPAGQRPKLA